MNTILILLIVYLLGFLAFFTFSKKAFEKVYEKQKFPYGATFALSIFWPFLLVYYIYAYIVYRR